MPPRKRAPKARKKTARPKGGGHPLAPRLPPRLAAAVERLRNICLALPDTTEKIAWGEATWRAGKIFAQMDTFHHKADHVAVWLPARDGLQQELVAENPVQFFVPPYVGPKGWIGVRIDRKPDWNVVAGLVADAYRVVAPPASVEKLEASRRR